MRLDAYKPPAPVPEPAGDPYDLPDEQEPYPDPYDPVTGAVAQYLDAAVRILDEQFRPGYAETNPYLTASVLVCLSAEVTRQEMRGEG